VASRSKVLVAIPKLSKIFAGPPGRAQWLLTNWGTRWIGPQRGCNIVDVQRTPGATLIFPICPLFPLTSAEQSKAARNVPAALAAGAVPTVEGGSAGGASADEAEAAKQMGRHRFESIEGRTSSTPDE
jgi:hypothetical protein